MPNLQFDYVQMIFTIVMIIWFAALRLHNPSKYSLKKPVTTVVIGIAALIFITIINNSQEKRSDLDYILSFLCLKKVSVYHQGYYVRGILSLSYIAIIAAGLQLLLDCKSSSNNNTKDDHGHR